MLMYLVECNPFASGIYPDVMFGIRGIKMIVYGVDRGGDSCEYDRVVHRWNLGVNS